LLHLSNNDASPGMKSKLKNTLKLIEKNTSLIEKSY
jgi:hypothetical protein